MYKPQVKIGNKQLDVTQCPSYIDEDDCKCVSCDLFKEWFQTICQLFWLGIIFPPFWIINIAQGIYILLRTRLIDPKRYNEFIQVFKIRGLNVTEHASIDEYQFLNVHYNRRDKIYSYVGYSGLGLIIWTIVFMTLMYNFRAL